MRLPSAVLAFSAALALVGPPPMAAAATAPAPTFAPADKQGFGTSHTTASKVWFTLEHGAMSEVYYPDLGTPAVRELSFVVSDGTSFAVRDTTSTTQRSELVPGKGLSYRQVDTDRGHRWRLTKTYVTDPARATVMVDVRFESLTGKPYSLYVFYDPSLRPRRPVEVWRKAGAASTALADLASWLSSAPSDVVRPRSSDPSTRPPRTATSSARTPC